MIVGVLALQGAFREHLKMLRGCGAEGLEIRLPFQLDGIDGLTYPRRREHHHYRNSCWNTASPKG